MRRSLAKQAKRRQMSSNGNGMSFKEQIKLIYGTVICAARLLVWQPRSFSCVHCMGQI